MNNIQSLNLSGLKYRAIRKMLEDDNLLPSVTPTGFGKLAITMTVVLTDDDFLPKEDESEEIKQSRTKENQ